MYKYFLKSFFDRVFSILLILAFSPAIILISFLIYFNMGRPILFQQTRIGYQEATFRVLKFRTMRPREEFLDDVPSAQRITKLGRFLRRSSLDELPQLLNIVKNDMSFIGPRPLLPDYLPLYSKEQRLRHSIKPGLTGLAQVKGRNKLSWKEKFSFDTYYLNNMSFILDLKIVILTIIVICSGSGASPVDREIAQRFNGKN